MRKNSGQLVAIGLIIGIILLFTIFIAKNKNNVRNNGTQNVVSNVQKGDILTTSNFENGNTNDLPTQKSDTILTINDK